MHLPETNPDHVEGINSSRSSGLGEFVKLAMGLGLAAAVVTATLVVAIGWVAPWIPFAWEESIAGPVDPVESPVDPEAQTALRELAHKLAEAGDLPQGVTIRVHLSDQATPNAFATLGGHVVVTRGLIEAVSSENALAMVVAHEIAHIARRHPIQALGRAAVLQLAWAALAGATGQGAVEQVLGRAGLLTVLRFNREMERAADRAALTTLERHYGHVGGAAEFFRTLQARDGTGAWADFLRTHPRPADRLEAIERRSRDKKTPPTPLAPPLAALGQDG
jgi:predicted Zn-dependent protease